MGFLGKFFGSVDKNQSSSEISLERALDIIGDYGDCMENSAPAPGCVADAIELPYPKMQIKEALIVGLKGISDPKMKDAIMTGYLHLADWQEGVGDFHVGLDIGSFELGGDIRELAEKIASQGDEFEKWQSVVAAEQEDLKNDLVKLGFWRGDTT